MNDKTLMDLFQDTIRDIYNSEQQLLRAMPKMHEAAQNPQLKDAIALHITQTEGQIARVEGVARQLGFDPGGVVCQGTVGLIKESEEHLQEFGGSQAGDAAIIACAQKNEHYEIANYGTAITWAKLLGLNDAAEMLGQNLNEEEETDQILSQIAETANREAAQGAGDFDPVNARSQEANNASLI